MSGVRSGALKYSRLLGVLAAVTLVGLVVLTDRLLQPGAFPVKRVTFEGEFEQVRPEELEHMVHAAVQGNYFAIDLAEVARAARRHPWVDRVTVRREWPQTLHVRYTEHRLVAHWGGDQWLSASGALITLPASASERDLPELSGPADSQRTVLARYRALGRLLAPYRLRLVALRLDARRAWRARVVSEADGGPAAGFELVFGKSALESRLERFVRVYRQELAKSPRPIRYVDLRYPNGFAVAWADAGSKAGKES